MKQKSINLQRTESILKELISEAFASLDDSNINGVAVLRVDCKRGKYDADVYLDPTMLTEEDKRYIIKHLKLAKGIIKNYILQSTNWYRVPKLKFIFDNSLEKEMNIEKLFEQIHNELEKKKSE